MSHGNEWDTNPATNAMWPDVIGQHSRAPCISTKSQPAASPFVAGFVCVPIIAVAVPSRILRYAHYGHFDCIQIITIALKDGLRFIPYTIVYDLVDFFCKYCGIFFFPSNRYIYFWFLNYGKIRLSFLSVDNFLRVLTKGMVCILWFTARWHLQRKPDTINMGMWRAE